MSIFGRKEEAQAEQKLAETQRLRQQGRKTTAGKPNPPIGALIAFAVSVLWPAAFIGFVVWREDFELLMEGSIIDLAVLLTAMLGPVMLSWLIALFFSRDREMTAHRAALEERLSQLTFADDVANDRVREISIALQRQAEDLMHASVDAVERVRDADELLRQRAKQLWQASDGARERAEALAEQLVTSARDITEGADRINIKKDSIEDYIREQDERLDELIESAKDRVAQVVDVFQDRLGGVSVYAEEAAQQAMGQADEVSKAIGGRLEQMLEAIYDTIRDAERKTTGMGENVLVSMNDAKRMTDDIALNMQSAINQVTHKAQAFTSGAGREIAIIAKDAETASGVLAGHLDKIAGSVEQIQSEMNEQGNAMAAVADAARQQLQDQANVIINAVEHVQKALGGQADAVTAAVDRVHADLRQRSEAVADALEQRLGAVGQNIDDLMDRVQVRTITLQEDVKVGFGALENAVEETVNRATPLIGELRRESKKMRQDTEHLISQETESSARLNNTAKSLQATMQVLSEQVLGLEQAAQRTDQHLSEAGDRMEIRAGALAVTSEEVVGHLTTAADRAVEQSDALRAQLSQADQGATVMADAALAAREQLEATVQIYDATSEKMALQAKKLTGVAELAQAEANSLGDSFAQHTAVMNEAIDEISSKTDRITKALEEKLLAFDAIATRIGAQAEGVRTQLDAAGLSAEEKLGHLSGNLKSVGQDLRLVVDDLAQTSEESRSTLSSLHQNLQQTRDEMTTAGDLAVGIYDRISGALISNSDALKTSISEAGELGDEMDMLSSDLAKRMRDVGKGLDEKILELRELQGSFAEGSNEIASAAEQGLERLRVVKTGLQGGIENLQDASLQAVNKITKTLASMNERTADLDYASDNIAAKLTGAVDALRREFDGFSQRLVSLSDQVEQTGEAIHGRSLELDSVARRTSESSKQISEAMHRQARELIKASDLAAKQTDDVMKRNTGARRKSFMRDLTFITERLNSLSIDISRAIERNVPDESWNRYLDGDRSIFTRGLIRRTDNFSLTAIKNHYQDDQDFREHVNRYLSQFEEALEQSEENDPEDVLSTTLLSSDVGKLYLLLSRALGRIR